MVSETEFPHNVARSPTPPIRYELKEDCNKRYGIKRNRGKDKHPRPSNRTEHSPSKKTEQTREKMKSKSPSRINKPRVRADDDDDNMSLISMTNLIANDVCRLQNCKYDNIGPRIDNESSIIDLNISYKPQNNGNHPKNSSSGVWVNKPTLLTDYQTSDTGSMTSRSHSRSSKHNRRMMNVNYESDTISEITPPRCAAAFEMGKRGSHQNNKSQQKQSTPEETFREFLSSVATCLPNASDLQHVQRTFSDAQTKFEITNKQGMPLRNHISSQNLCNGPTLCQKNQGVHPNASGNNTDFMLLKHGGNSFDDGSITSASSLPYFRNNSDRYNHLVNGRELAYMQAAKDGKPRKFSRSWFKKSKRRNTTKVVPPQHVTVPHDDPQGPCNMEGIWKQQSRSFDENEKRLSAKANKLTKPRKEAKTPLFQKLLKRGKSKERKRLKDKQSGKQVSAATARSVTITANDPTKWPPGKDDVFVSSCDDAHVLEASKCVASTIVTAVSSPGETAMNVINSDVALALVGAPPASAVAVAISNAKKRETAQQQRNRTSEEQKDEAPSKDEVITIGPVWKNDKQAPKALMPPATRPRPITETKSMKKSRPRCYHRNSDLLDDDFAPTLSWRKSRSYDSPANPIAKKHSYSEDDFGQENFKVVSIIGHDISSSELERYGSLNLSHNGGVTNTLFSDRHQQVFAKSKQRNALPRHRHSKGYSNGNNSPTSSVSYSTSSSDSFSSDETTSSSSSSSAKRPIRVRSKPQTRLKSPREVAAASNATMKDADNEYTSDSEAAMEAALLATPWRKDYETHMASKGSKSAVVPSIGPLEPPKIQRSALPRTSIPKISPPRKDVPMRRLLV